MQVFCSRIQVNKLNPPNTHSYIKFYVCDVNNVTLTTALELYPIDGQWMDLNYDLSAFAGQTIKLHWNHYYNSGTPCNFTTHCLDDIVVYAIPDIEGPNIDFITGNSVEIDEEMNLLIEFNDASGIDGVTANYSIESDSNTITLFPVKGTYNYTGSIPARDHECDGSISYKITDTVGNETNSSGHTINWGTGIPVLSVPANVVITSLSDSTVVINWDIVEGATDYKVFSSLDPYGVFTEDSTGTFTQSREWQKVIDDNKYFYYVIAVNTSKINLDAIKEEEFEIAKPKEDKK